jgi:hypothetical protein
MCIVTIRVALKSESRPQKPNAWGVRLAAQTWPRVTSSFLDISKGNYLTIIVRVGRALEHVHRGFDWSPILLYNLAISPNHRTLPSRDILDIFFLVDD